MLLRDFLNERGWTAADLAVELDRVGYVSTAGANIGQPLSASAIGKKVSRPVPRTWLDALGVEPDEEPATDGGGSTGRSESPPARPPGAAIVLEAGAKERIAGAYRFVGGMLGAGVARDRGLEVGNGVAAVWTDSADKIAECWIKAAETNPWARRFVDAMNAGGPVGDLVGVHLYLAGGTAYVLGASLPDALFAKYSRYRVVESHAEPSRDNGASAAHEPAASPVVDGSS